MLSRAHPPRSSENTQIVHKGKCVDIVQLVQQLVSDQIAPLRQELHEQASQHASLQHQLLTQRICDQEQSFLRGLSDYWRSHRDLQALRRERAKLKDHSSEAQQLNADIRQDESLLDKHMSNLRRIYAGVMQAAHDNNITLLTLTGDDEQDFGSSHA